MSGNHERTASPLPSASGTAVRVLLVEDDDAISELLCLHLRRAGFAVQRVVSAEEALSQLQVAVPSLLLVDWMLPGVSGIGLLSAVRQSPAWRDLPVILLTARGAEDDKVTGLDAGADDYITKPFSPKELVARLRSLLRRRVPPSDGGDKGSEAEWLRAGLLLVNTATHEVTAAGQILSLNRSEYRLLKFLIAHRERVYSRNALINAVWGVDVYIDERTVDVHIRRLRAAMRSAGCAQMIETVRGEGYRLHVAAEAV